MVLKNGAFEIRIDPDRAAVASVVARGGATIWGDEPDALPRMQVSRIGVETLWSGPNWPELSLRVTGRQTATDRVEFTLAVDWDKTHAVDFEVYYALHEDGILTAGYRGVREHAGFQLLAVRLPALATALSVQPGARLALPVNGGRLVDPGNCPDAGGHAWAGWNWQAMAVAAYHDALLAVVQVDHVDDVIRFDVGQTRAPLPAHLVASLSSPPPVRSDDYARMQGLERCVYQAGAYSRRAAVYPEFQHRAPSPFPEKRFVLHEASQCTVRYVAAAPTQRVDWRDAARVLRSQVAARPPLEHRGVFLYGVYSDVPGYKPKQLTTFDQSLADVRVMHHLTGGVRQNPKLIGWQHNGHDTGYPDTSVVNPALGGEERLRHLIEQAREKYDATVGCHDNLQSAYKHSPAWNDSIVMRDQNGELARGGVWAGGQLYLIHYHTYWENGQLPGRLRDTYDRFPFAGTFYFDEMSVWLQKRDYRADAPASGQQCFEAMQKVCQFMRDRGILLMSEGFTGNLVGHLSHGWLLQEGPYDRFPHGERIPFTHMIFHGRATYGGDVGPGPDHDPLVLEALFNGRTVSSHISRSSNPKTVEQLAAAYHLVHVPYSMLREREVDNVEQTGAQAWTIRYGPNPATGAGEALSGEGKTPLSDTFVKVDFAADRYEVVVNGRCIARDFSTFAEAPDGSGDWIAYAKNAGPVRYARPPGWQGTVCARRVTAEGLGDPVQCSTDGADLLIDVPAGTPVRVTLVKQTRPISVTRNIY